MIFGFGKKQVKKTFKQRVTDFWQWYPEVAHRFFQTIERGECSQLTDEVAGVMEKTLPRLAWVFGPGENGGHSFTVSGEGVAAKQLLAEYWHSRALEIPKWTFFGSRQPSDVEHLKGFAIRYGQNESVDTEGFLIRTKVNAETKKIDILAWHPMLESIPENDRYQILFILLDEALGEFGTGTWLGEIKIEPFAAGQGTITLATLPVKIQQVHEYYKWQLLPPLRSYTLYEVKEQSSAPRGDSFVGSTCIPDIVFEYLNKGALDDNPLQETGAEFAYLAIDGSVFPDGQQTAVRGNIEDAVDSALVNAESGRALGGAFGLQQSYIDLIFFDGDNSRKIVDNVLSDLQLRGRAHVLAMA